MISWLNQVCNDNSTNRMVKYRERVPIKCKIMIKSYGAIVCSLLYFLLLLVRPLPRSSSTQSPPPCPLRRRKCCFHIIRRVGRVWSMIVSIILSHLLIWPTIKRKKKFIDDLPICFQIWITSGCRNSIVIYFLPFLSSAPPLLLLYLLSSRINTHWIVDWQVKKTLKQIDFKSSKKKN